MASVSLEARPAVNRVLPGDCLTSLRQLPDGMINLAFADPPFNIGFDYDVYHDDRDSRAYLDWSRQWGEEIVRVLAPDGAFWLAIGDEYAAELKVMFHRELNLHLRNWVVWYYTFGVHCQRKFTRSHAHLLYFVKDPKHFTFNDESIRVPSARQLVYADRRANPLGRLPDDTWILRPQDLPEDQGFSPAGDTWTFSRVCGTFKERQGWHGCQMPEQLLGRIIRACSHPGDLVLDPFAGSGTTLAVAKKLHRNYLGMELSDDYSARARARLESIQPGDPLVGNEAPGVIPNRTRNRSHNPSATPPTRRYKPRTKAVITPLPQEQTPTRVEVAEAAATAAPTQPDAPAVFPPIVPDLPAPFADVVAIIPASETVTVPFADPVNDGINNDVINIDASVTEIPNANTDANADMLVGLPISAIPSPDGRDAANPAVLAPDHANDADNGTAILISPSSLAEIVNS